MKLLIIGSIVTVILMIAGALLLSSVKSETPITGQVEGLEANPESYELGDIPINGGLVTKDYEVKNITDKTVKLKKIATSCMCTKAKVTINNNETRLFSMEGMGDKNPPVNLELEAGKVAKVTAVFDPAAHGPKGIGPIDRSVILTFSDPVGIKELKFNGKVVN